MSRNLRIGYLSTFYHTAHLVMGLPELAVKLPPDTTWRMFGTGPAIIKAFEQSELDLAYIGLPPAMIGIKRGLPIKCIAGGHTDGTVIAGMKGMLTLDAKGEVGAVLNQLKGKRIGVPSRGSIHDVILSDALKEHDLSGEVEVINYRWADEIVEAMAKGEVEAGCGTPALAVSARVYAKGELIVPAGVLWPDNPSYGIVTREELIETDAGVLENFIALHEQASQMMRMHAGDVAQTIAGMAGVVDGDFISQVLEVSPRYCASLSRKYIDCTMRFASVMLKLGYLDSSLTEADVFDTRLIDKVHPGPDHYGGGLIEL